MSELERLAEQIPSMGGHKIGPELRAAARDVEPGHAIIEVGTWLGAGTAHMALGVRDSGRVIPIHCYDRWRASPNEVEKAGKAGLQLSEGQDTLPMVQRMLEAFGTPIEFHQGNILRATWDEMPIGLYVDDAAKRPAAFHHVLRTFGPSFVPGRTMLFLMDFNFWKKLDDPDMRCQMAFINRHSEHFELIGNFGPTIAAFRYIKPLAFERITRRQLNGWVYGGFHWQLWHALRRRLGIHG